MSNFSLQQSIKSELTYAPVVIFLASQLSKLQHVCHQSIDRHVGKQLKSFISIAKIGLYLRGSLNYVATHCMQRAFMLFVQLF